MGTKLSLSINSKKINATRLDISARQFTFIADEPEQLGGQDEGPNPLEYLLGGFAACLNVVAHIVAKEQNIEYSNLEIAITGHDLNTARFLGEKTDARAGFKNISVNFNVESDASQEALEHWLATVEKRCPAADIISNATPVKIAVNQLVLA